MTLEGKVKAEIKEYLDTLKPALWYFMPANNGYGRRGIPDFVGCYLGFSFVIEAKAGDNVPTPWQDKELKAAFNAGSAISIAYNVDAAKGVMERIRARRDAISSLMSIRDDH